MNRILTYTGGSKRTGLTRNHIWAMALLMVLMSAVSAVAGHPLREGIVAARGVVLQETELTDADGNAYTKMTPVWVEYGEDGKILKKIDATGSQDPHNVAISRDEYPGRAANDDTWDPDPRVLSDSRIQSILMNSLTKQVIHISENTIGYWSAFYTEPGQKPKDYNPGLTSMYGFERIDDTWAPISGVKVSAGASGVNWSGDVTDSDGSFTVGIPGLYQSCLSYTQQCTLSATFRFTKFDPDYPTGFYYLTKQTAVTAEGNASICSAQVGHSLAAQSAVTALTSANATDTHNNHLVNFTVDVAILNGQGIIENVIDPDHVSTLPLGDEITESVTT